MYEAGDLIDGAYRVAALLGQGGAGAVYRANAVEDGREVAIKCMHSDFLTSDDARERFQREARALNGLAHPHIIRIEDYGITAEGPYLVMELLRGKTLEAHLELGAIPPELALDNAIGVVAGLAYAHRSGVLHRDIKPDNVFMAEDETGIPHPKLLDFGLVKFLDRDRWAGRTLTQDGAVLGTPIYMAPEQSFGMKVDARADVYAAGCLLFELLTGEPPYLGDSRAEMVRLHATAPIPRVRDRKESLAVRGEIDDVIARALAKEPEARFASAGEMLTAMQEIPRPLEPV